jgi:hypothetical protein
VGGCSEDGFVSLLWSSVRHETRWISWEDGPAGRNKRNASLPPRPAPPESRLAGGRDPRYAEAPRHRAGGRTELPGASSRSSRPSAPRHAARHRGAGGRVYRIGTSAAVRSPAGAWPCGRSEYRHCVTMGEKDVRSALGPRNRAGSFESGRHRYGDCASAPNTNRRPRG